jgi:lysophospholipase L1-like esterase
MHIYQHRGGLRRTLQALRAGKVTLGFIGGSITDPRPGWNWPEPVCAWFNETYPSLRVVVENAAIGATGSDLAVFRARRDLIERGCDLVFVEFAVNDSGTPSEQRQRTREGLLRKLLAGEGRDVVLVYTFMQTLYAEMIAGQVPATIAEFETLGKHYQLGSVWMGLHALNEVRQGRMRWEDWLPDGLHPQQRGSLSYAQSVTAFLQRELISAPSTTAIPTGADLPPALNACHWEGASELPFDAVRLEGPWTVQRWAKYNWIEQTLHTAAPGARLSFEFDGRGVLLGCDFGKSSAEFLWRIDGGDWHPSERDRPDWAGAEGWYRTTLLSEDLPPGRHTCELVMVHGNPDGTLPGTAYTGTTFDLGLIGVII